MIKYPKKITVGWINEQIQKNSYPNMYPDKEFLKEHYNIVNPYRTEINLYKGNCYKELNTYYKTGEIIMQGGCPPASLDTVAEKAGKKGLTAPQKVKLVADRLEELYDKVKPLDHDIIVYRGVKRGTIGQNLYTGDCIKTRLYDLDMHRFCDNEDIKDIQLYDQRKPNEDPKPFVYETLGLVSTSTKIGTAMGFSMIPGKYDTIIALRLPAGTKFIMPVDATGYDYEYELILFPQQSTFVINNTVDTKQDYPIYVGAFCNELNKYRPKGGPKLRELKTKILNPHQWLKAHTQTNPLLVTSADKCVQNNTCKELLHFCDPETGKCIGDNPANRQKIQDWWRKTLVTDKHNVKGKCTVEKVEKCVDNYQACNPDTGDCLTDKDMGIDYFSYGGLIQKQVLNWISAEELEAKKKAKKDRIIKEQKPRYQCTSAKIKECAEKGDLCHPVHKTQLCKHSHSEAEFEGDLYYVNNVIDRADLKKLAPYGKCNKVKINHCADLRTFCDPDTAKCLEFNVAYKNSVDKIHDLVDKWSPPVTSDYALLTIPLLKAELKKRGLPVSGNKAELIARLIADDK